MYQEGAAIYCSGPGGNFSSSSYRNLVGACIRWPRRRTTKRSAAPLYLIVRPWWRPGVFTETICATKCCCQHYYASNQWWQFSVDKRVIHARVLTFSTRTISLPRRWCLSSVHVASRVVVLPAHAEDLPSTNKCKHGRHIAEETKKRSGVERIGIIYTRLPESFTAQEDHLFLQEWRPGNLTYSTKE